MATKKPASAAMTFDEWVEYQRLKSSAATDGELRELRSSQQAVSVLYECGWDVTTSNLDYFVRKEFVSPRKSGKDLRWSPADFDTLRLHLESIPWERSEEASLCHAVGGRLIDYWRSLYSASKSEGLKHGFRGDQIDINRPMKFDLTIKFPGFGRDTAEFIFTVREDFLQQRREMMKGGAN